MSDKCFESVNYDSREDDKYFGDELSSEDSLEVSWDGMFEEDSDGINGEEDVPQLEPIVVDTPPKLETGSTFITQESTVPNNVMFNGDTNVNANLDVRAV